MLHRTPQQSNFRGHSEYFLSRSNVTNDGIIESTYLFNIRARTTMLIFESTPSCSSFDIVILEDCRDLGHDLQLGSQLSKKS